jgi:hypothetical protein
LKHELFFKLKINNALEYKEKIFKFFQNDVNLKNLIIYNNNNNNTNNTTNNINNNLNKGENNSNKKNYLEIIELFKLPKNLKEIFLNFVGDNGEYLKASEV